MTTALVTVNVTQEDIKPRRVKTCAGCPVALAINRVISPMWVEVRSRIVYFYKGPRYAGMATVPLSVTRFVKMHDLGWQVSPFSFDLEVPTEEEA